MGLGAGILRHRITLKKVITKQNQKTGEMKTHAHNVGKVWARVTQLSGRELLAAQAKESKVSAKITIRKRSQVDNTWIAIHGEKTYNVEAVIDDNESGQEWQTLLVSEGVRREY